MLQKVVIKVTMKEQKSRCKVMRIVGCVPGLQSVAFVGQDKNHLVLIGDGIDAVALTTLLRKKVGSAELLSVGPVQHGGYGDGTLQIPVGGYNSYNPDVYGSYQGYETRNQNSFAYGPGYGYETRNHYPYDDGPGHGYVAKNQNPDNCSIM